jgi:outer membrane receptor protein involved in Fe transport
MRSAAWLTLLLAAGVFAPGAALGQEPAQLALARPQPHFVAAWAPKKEREAERSAVLARRVSLALTDVSLDAALKALTNQAGLRITYSPAVLPAGKRVTISASDVAVVTALTEMLFRSGLDVVVDRDGALALVRCRHVAPREEVQDSGSIVGRVTDKGSGSPLVGATVVVEEMKLSATTGPDGRYRIRGVAAGTYTVRARYIGYALLSISVSVTVGGEQEADFALQKSAQQLDQLVVTGTETPTAERGLPSPITVITNETIEEKHVQRVDQLFRGDVPGMFAWDRGTSNYFTTIDVRGASSLSAPGYIKTYIDGVEVTNPSFIATLDPYSIERVEVIRGPQASTIYGSDALNGVLQIFTKTGALGTRPHLDATASAGALQTKWNGTGAVDQQDYAASFSAGGEQFSYSIGGARTHTGEWVKEYYNNGNSLYGRVNGGGGAINVDLSGRYYLLRQGQALPPVYGPYTGPPLNLAPINTDQRIGTATFGLTLGYRATPKWVHSITLGYDRATYEAATRPRLTSPDDTLSALYDDEGTKASVRYNTTLTLAMGRLTSLEITGGADYYDRRESAFYLRAPQTSGNLDAGSFLFGSRSVLHNSGYFTQAQLGLQEHFYITAGLRAEDNATFGRDFGLAWAPRVGLAYVTEIGRFTVKARSSYGKGIRPPPQGTRDASVTPDAVLAANPLLAPEVQKGWDAGAELYYGGLLSLKATRFDQRAEDLIDQVLIDPGTTPPTYQYQNVGRVKNRGWELSLSAAPVNWVSVDGSYTFTTSRVLEVSPTYSGDLRIGDQLLGIPRHTFGLAARFRLGRANAALGMTHVSSWTETDLIALVGSIYGGQPPRPSGRDYWITYPGFAKYSFNLSYEISPRIYSFLSVDNLTNNYAYERSNVDAVRGRLTVGGLRVRL